jgi:hypothetical protein
VGYLGAPETLCEKPFDTKSCLFQTSGLAPTLKKRGKTAALQKLLT